MKSSERILRGFTGQRLTWWICRVEKIIAEQYQGGDFWLISLSREITQLLSNRGMLNVEGGDGNIVCGMVMTVILAAWTARIHRAKAYDNRRDTNVRRLAMRELLRFGNALTECLVDESHDHCYFPGHGWEPPYQLTKRRRKVGC